MRFAFIAAAGIAAVPILGCGGDEVAGPEERRLTDPVLIIEHWILSDPSFERGEVIVGKYVSSCPGCEFQIGTTLEWREVYRTTLPATGEVRITLPIKDERCGYFAWPETDPPDWKFPTLFLRYSGTWTGGRNQDCSPGEARLNRLPCTIGPHVVREFESVQGCTPTGR